MKEENTFVAGDKNEVVGREAWKFRARNMDGGRVGTRPYRCTKCEVDIHSRVVKRKGDRGSGKRYHISDGASETFA